MDAAFLPRKMRKYWVAPSGCLPSLRIRITTIPIATIAIREAVPNSSTYASVIGAGGSVGGGTSGGASVTFRKVSAKEP